MNSSDQNLRQLLFALAAMALGMALAWSQIALRKSPALPDQSIAKVGDALISTADFQRAIAATESARRNPLALGQREAVLNKLISEQLLLQYGEDLGLVRSDPAVRKLLVQSVLGLVRANVAAPDAATARQWYANNKPAFLPPSLYRVRVYQLDSKEAAGRAAELLRKGASLPAELESRRLNYLPNALLPPAKLKDYIGDHGWTLLAEQPQGAVLGPQKLLGKWSAIQLLEKRTAVSPPFEQISDEVVNALTRERGEQALEKLISRLREDYGVVIDRAVLGE